MKFSIIRVNPINFNATLVGVHGNKSIALRKSILYMRRSVLYHDMEDAVPIGRSLEYVVDDDSLEGESLRLRYSICMRVQEMDIARGIYTLPDIYCVSPVPLK